MLVQRWPAVPAAEKTMPRVVRSRSADGPTIAALLPPSSSRDRPNRAATRGPTSRPIRVEPVAESSATAGVVDQCQTHGGVAQDHLRDVGGEARLRQRARQQGGRCERAQRRLLGGFPDHGVAAHQGDGGVPRPHRDGEVERRDHADHAERVPGLHQPVAGPLGGHRPTEQLPRQPHGVVADVDHLLDLAARLGGDLADLDADERGEVVEVLAEQLAEPAHHGAADRCRHQPPLVVRRRGPRDDRRDLGG